MQKIEEYCHMTIMWTIVFVSLMIFLIMNSTTKDLLYDTLLVMIAYEQVCKTGCHICWNIDDRTLHIMCTSRVCSTNILKSQEVYIYKLGVITKILDASMYWKRIAMNISHSKVQFWRNSRDVVMRWSSAITVLMLA